MAVLLLLAQGCSDSTAPAELSAPTEVQATALGLNAVRVTWKPSAGVTSYALERRTDLTGPFETIADAVRGDGSSLISYFDTTVEPEHYYGYRVRAVGALSARSDVSTVAGARTASVPGVLIRLSTTFATPASADADGFLVSVRGPKDTSSFAVAINGERLISPLPKGSYTIVLRGLAVNCNPTTLGDTTKTVQVSDEGLNTVGTASFSISCRDPKKASIVTTVRTAGDTTDADGVLMTVSGIIREAGTPANERVYFQSRTLQGVNPAARFDDLRPGDYEVSISDVESPCVLEGERKRTLQPKALAVDTVPFVITCRKPTVPVDTVGKPLVLRQTWSVASARPGDRVSLLTALDLRASPTETVSGASATIQFDNATVRYDSAKTTRAFDVTAINQPQANVVSFAAAQTGSEPLSGNIEILRVWFTVVGPVGNTVTSGTTIGEILSPALVRLNNKVRVSDATLTVTTGGGTTNQSPTAVITGLTTGPVGTALALSGGQSSDPDGTIASYAWNFGNGQSGTGPSVSPVFSAAGTYTVRLTVTDNQGATATRDVVVTISAVSPSTGTITGTVTSTQVGALAGVTVSVSGGASSTTNVSGSYTIANVPAGVRSISVSGLPATCTAPAAQSSTVTASAPATVNFTVTCTTGGGTGSTGTVAGRVTRVSDGSGIGFARVSVQPTGGAARPPVSTAIDGAYSVSAVPAGGGSVTVSDLPTGCTAPAAQAYSALAANGTVTVNIAVTCTVATTGTITGRVTKSTGGNAAGVSVVVTPTGATALAAVTTDASGLYTVANVPAGAGSVTLAALPAGCSAPANVAYSSVTAGVSLTRDFALTCVAGPHTYPLTAVWGAITNTGPTGRQAALTFSIDMGSAPGRADIAGSAADPLAGITLQITFDGTKLAYQSRSLLSPDEFDLAAAGTTGAGSGTAITTMAIGSSSAQTKTGAFSIVRITFNIASGASGSVTPTAAVPEALATSFLLNVTSSVVANPIPTLVIPP